MKKQRLHFWPLLILGFLLGMLIAKVSRSNAEKQTQDQLPQEINTSPNNEQNNTVRLFS